MSSPRQIANRVEDCPTLPWSTLRDWTFNELKASNRKVDELIEAVLSEGICFPLMVWEDGKYVFDGTGRRLCYDAIEEMGHTLPPIPIVRVRAPDLDGAKKLALMASSQHGQVTQRSFDLFIGSFESVDLKAMAGQVRFDGISIQVMGAGEGGGEQNAYTQRIEAPVYEPTGEPPVVEALADRAKADQLLKEIEAAELPEKVAAFLRHAAERHVIFHYGQIANYYAHAPSEVQELMERSALVIVDFQKAIELGFVQLNEDVEAAFKKDYPDA